MLAQGGKWVCAYLAGKRVGLIRESGRHRLLDISLGASVCTATDVTAFDTSPSVSSCEPKQTHEQSFFRQTSTPINIIDMAGSQLLSDAQISKMLRSQPRELATGTPSRIASLPEELVSNIVARLGCDDKCALRLTCKALQAKSLHEFGTEHFGSKAFMFTTESLNVLVGIANHKQLRGFLQGITITTALFTDKVIDSLRGHTCGHQPSVRQTEAYQNYIDDQIALKTSGEDRRMLAKAFNKLEVIPALLLADHPASLPVGTDYRGGNKVRRVTGAGPLYPTSSQSKEAGYVAWQTHVWSRVVLAAVDAGVRVQRLDVLFDNGTGLSAASNLKFYNNTLVGLKGTFDKLEHLRLNLHSMGALEKNLPAIRSFAGAIGAPLKSLHMSYDLNDRIGNRHGSGLIHDNLVNRMRLDSLKALTIDNLTVELPVLSKTISRLTALTDLYLQSINLRGGTWIPILRSLQKIDSLESLHLLFVLEGGRKAFFLTQVEPEEAVENEVPPWADLMGFAGDGDEAALEGEGTDDDSLPALEPGESSEDDGIPQLSPGVTFENTTNEDALPAQNQLLASKVSTGTSESGLTENAPPSDTDHDLPLAQLSGKAESVAESSDGKTERFASAEQDVNIDDNASIRSDEAVVGITEQPASANGHASAEFKAPGSEHHTERGYYVCIHGKDKVAAQIPRLIAEYNIGGDPHEPDDLMAPPPGMPLGLPPGMNFNNFLTAVATAIGVPGPPPPAFLAGPAGNGMPGQPAAPIVVAMGQQGVPTAPAPAQTAAPGFGYTGVLPVTAATLAAMNTPAQPATPPLQTPQAANMAQESTTSADDGFMGDWSDEDEEQDAGVALD